MSSILIVDDNPDDREFLSRSLRRNSAIEHEVLEAQDETSCLEILQSGRKIDCILLDYSLPGQDGLKVLSHILDADPAASVVMISGQGNESVAVEALKRGALDYFVKSAYPPSAIEASVLDAIRRTSSARRSEERRVSLRSLADVMIHDLRDPLDAVQQSTEALRRELAPEAAEEHAPKLDVIENGIARIDRFLRVLQDYASQDGSDGLMEEVDLDAQVSAVRATLKPELEAAGGRIDCPERLPVIVSNRARIAQLLEHLVRNGIQYNRSDQPVVRITTRTHATRWSIDVADNGIGIAPSEQERVFEPFTRLDPGDTSRGSGLGLATARRIAQRLGCGLTCSSLPGEGAVFTLSVPMPGSRPRGAGSRHPGGEVSPASGRSPWGAGN